MLLCFDGFSQTNGKGVLKKNVFQLNNGIRLSKGDTIMLGEPKNGADKFTYIIEPKHAFGLLGGDGADKKYSYKMLIIHFFTTKKDKENNEKQVIASLGYGKDEIILDCEIAEAIENGEIIAKGKIAQKFNIAATNDAVKKEEVSEPPKQIIAEKPAIKITGNALLNKINELQKNNDLTDSEHYQLLKLVTGSGDNIDDKKSLTKKLQALRNNYKITIEEYDEIIELLLQ
jgi:hypothetical protein